MKSIAVVDAYSTGSMLAPACMDAGFRTVHIDTGCDLHSELKRTFVGRYFDESVSLTRIGVEEIAVWLQSLGTVAVVPGTESGIEVAERLAAILDLSGNDPMTLDRRRDKFETIKSLKGVGLPHPISHVFDKATDALSWIERHGLRRIVIKPCSSAGSDRVVPAFLEEGNDAGFESLVRDVFDDVLSRPNIFGEPNSGVLVQEFIEGPEYVVDTVSCNGDHKVTDVWIYKKIRLGEHDFVYKSEHLLNVDDLPTGLVEYALSALDALDIRFGPAHMELIQSKNSHPYLIDIGARPSGGCIHTLLQHCYDFTQIEATLWSYADWVQFQTLPDVPPNSEIHAQRRYVLPSIGGSVRLLDDFRDLRCYPAVKDIHLTYDVGQKIEPLSSLLSSVGHVDFAHRDRDAYKLAIGAFEALEAKAFI